MPRRLTLLAAVLVLSAAAALVLTRHRSPVSRARAAPKAAHVQRRKKARAATPQRVGGPHDAPVPILMYHVLGTPPSGAPYPGLFVSRADFAAQTAWLAAHGYHAVTLGRVFAYWRHGAALPSKPIVLTFDDGYLSDATVALPDLRRYRWPGVLNLLVKNIRRGDLTAYQVRLLMAAGWEIDAHTLTHVDLTTIDAARLRSEVAGSREHLRRLLGVPVSFFCYPSGRYDARVVAAVKAAGYLGATTVNPGVARPVDAFVLPRIRVDGGAGVAGLAEKLRQFGA